MISVILPVYNEADILEASILKIQHHLFQRSLTYEVIAVSNGSTDSTIEIGRKLADEHKWFRFFELPSRSVGSAFALGVREAGGEFIVSLDADLSFDMQFVDHAAYLLEYADMVVGSKVMGSQRRSLLRIIASQVYIFFTQIFFGLALSDYSIGCKAYRRSVILEMLPYLSDWTGYVFELSVMLKKKNLRIIQIGVDCVDLRKSHFNLFHEGIFRFWHLFKFWVKEIDLHYKNS